MRLNIFGLNNNQRNWEEVKHALHQVWVGNQSGATLPMFCDSDFQNCFNGIKKKYSLNYCYKKLEL